MDTPYRTRRRQRGRRLPLLPNFALIASLFVHTCHDAVADASPLPPLPAPLPAPHRLDRRIANEHVVLADCRDHSEVVSSQMAYYEDEIGPTPKDVAVVVTTPGQAALWVNTNTSGLFTDTGITFTSVLGPRVEDGQYAGVGYNGYANFTCYQSYVKELYTYERTACSQVYMCDHSTPPRNTPKAPTSGGGMSQGTIIGVAVGVVGGLLFVVAAGLVYWYFGRARRNTQTDGNTTLVGTATASSTGGPRTHSTGPGSDAGALDSVSSASQSPHAPAHAWPGVQPLGTVYEMDGRHDRAEMGTDKAKFEMDAAGHGRAELGPAMGGSGPSSPEPNQSSAVFPASPALPNSPAILGPVHAFPQSQQSSPPQSPPPEYSYLHTPR
ncbi:hypothetical protein C8A05DRAFT_45735 [Staphylotrichum tortipilum]|uniref:Uncharacterized protein n=1 Tax=Staphylotrichum tortipilum TaxID=2831512 RepID=A0AAN6MGS5_9PEZI|nr:hypothetical protein C8A05DRAFT_45735 [Staphylotrichum longicolle]